MIQIGKHETKVFLFADDMILCIKDFKASTRKLWLLININFLFVFWEAAYKFKTQNSEAFLHISSKNIKKEIWVAILFIVACKFCNKSNQGREKIIQWKLKVTENVKTFYTQLVGLIL